MRYFRLANLALALSIVPAASHAQTAEYVFVKNVLQNDDHGIVVRSNGEEYLIEKGVGCLSFWRFEGKRVLVTHSGTFGGVGSRLILPDLDQSCRIWIAELIASGRGTNSNVAPSPTADDIAAALELLGYSTEASVGTALVSFQRRAGINPDGRAGPETRLALSKALSSSFPDDLVALQVALRVLRGSPSGSDSCEEGHWVESVTSNGEIVKLEDGSIWQIDIVGQIHTMLWLPVQKVMVCDGALIDLRNGRRVLATRLR